MIFGCWTWSHIRKRVDGSFAAAKQVADEPLTDDITGHSVFSVLSQRRPLHRDGRRGGFPASMFLSRPCKAVSAARRTAARLVL